MNKRILIVDDSEPYKRDLEKTLEPQNPEIITVSSFSEGLMCLNGQNNIDLLVTERRIEGEDIELSHFLADVRKRPPTIIYTTFGTKNKKIIRLLAYRTLVEAYVNKLMLNTPPVHLVPHILRLLETPGCYESVKPVEVIGSEKKIYEGPKKPTADFGQPANHVHQHINRSGGKVIY